MSGESKRPDVAELVQQMKAPVPDSLKQAMLENALKIEWHRGYLAARRWVKANNKGRAVLQGVMGETT